MSARTELPPLREFDYMGRTLVLRHKLQPLVEERVIHRIENDHEVKTMWTTNSRGEGDIIVVVRFRVLHGLRDYTDFFVTDEYHICENTLTQNCTKIHGMVTVLRTLFVISCNPNKLLSHSTQPA